MDAISTAMTLPVPVAPQPDEAFSSWLVRLASAHGLRTRSLCSLLTGRRIEFNRDLDSPAADFILERVCACTHRDPESIRAGHTLAGFTGRLFTLIRPMAATPWLLPLGHFYRPRPAMQFCPACLREGTAYYRRSWRISLFGICPIHACRLHHVCQMCAEPISFVRTHLAGVEGTLSVCWHCGADACQAPTVPAEEVDVRLGCALLAALRGEVHSWPFQYAPSVEDGFLALRILCSRLLRSSPRLALWRELAARGAKTVLPTPSGRNGGTAFDWLADPAERLTVLRTACWLLDDWPERFLEVARAAHTRTSDFVESFAICPKWFLDPLQARLTPARRSPVPLPELARAKRMRQLVLEHRREWCPTKLPRLVRALRAAGFYSTQTDDAVIMRSLPNLITRLRAEGADYRKRLTVQVQRGTAEWSVLVLRAKPYRKVQCRSIKILRRGIKLLCSDHPLSSADLAELLHRSQKALLGEHLRPMVRAGELRTKFGENRGGSSNYPGQAYRAVQHGFE